MGMETKTVYFERGGQHNTGQTLELAARRARERGIDDIVVASYTGGTGVRAAEIFTDYNLIVVAGVYGFSEPNEIEMVDEHQAAIEANGGKILFAGHAFGMLGRAVNSKFGGIQADEIIAHTLRLISRGVKVGCEITCMAADAGLVRAGAEVIAIGGSGQGADSATVIKAGNTHTFFDSRILEIICKPRQT